MGRKCAWGISEVLPSVQLGRFYVNKTSPRADFWDLLAKDLRSIYSATIRSSAATLEDGRA